MRLESVDTAPVESVGGSQPRGPWPANLEEIAVGDEVTRLIDFDDGSTEERTVKIKDINQMLSGDGTESDGYTVSYTEVGP